MENKEILARALREGREEKGLTQEEMAARCRIDVRHYRNLEAGKNVPSLNVAVAAAQALDLSLDTLFLPGRDLITPIRSPGQCASPDTHSRQS